MCCFFFLYIKEYLSEIEFKRESFFSFSFMIFWLVLVFYVRVGFEYVIF